MELKINKFFFLLSIILTFFSNLAYVFADIPVPSHSPGHLSELIGIAIIATLSIGITIYTIFKLSKAEDDE